MASLPTTEEIRTALGLDPTSDEAIDAMMASTVAIIEGYLQRGIIFKLESEEIDPPDNHRESLLLFRFPVKQISTFTQDGAPVSGYRLYKKPGVVRWREACGCRWRGCCEAVLPLEIVYEGGYEDDAWPADLLDALMRVFYARWNASGGNLATTQAGGVNRSVTVDGLTITRDSASYAGSALADQVIPPELTSVAAQLDPYRARIVTGI